MELTAIGVVLCTHFFVFFFSTNRKEVHSKSNFNIVFRVLIFVSIETALSQRL